MNTRLLVIAAILFIDGAVARSTATAAAVVLENQTDENIDVTIRWTAGKESRHTLVAGVLRPIAVTGPVDIAFDADDPTRRRRLQPNSIHYFVRRDGNLELAQWKLPSVGDARADNVWLAPVRARPAAPDSVYSIPVKILADDQEPTVRAVWEKRLRDRLAEASDIFERHCRVRFKVVAVDTWVANTDIDDFNLSAADFERKVRPAPARLAIGFTGHYKWEKGESHVGGIRGPLSPHILIREALVKVSEPERLEVLVH